MDDAFLLAYSSYLIRGDQRVVRRHLIWRLWSLRHSEFVRCLTDLASNDGTRARTWTQAQVSICAWTHPIDPTGALSAFLSLDTRVMLLDGSVFVESLCSVCFFHIKSIQTIWDRRNVSLETPPKDGGFNSAHRMDVYDIPVSQVPFLTESDSLVWFSNTTQIHTE